MPERALAQFADHHRALAIILVGVTSLLIGPIVVAISGPPVPRVHDEFSYLLAADTFASGRITNPPHPMWRHFETMHVLSHPTRMSKFQPAQGLALAFGQVIFGAPWVGAVLSTALGCAAIAWALFGWTRPKWALVGGLLAAIHPQIVAWGHMYWGGSVSMIGGALVFGALGRILQRQHVAPNAALLALGGSILAASRPYEALVWAILSAITLIVWMLRARGTSIARIILPAMLVIAPVLAMLGYYNWRVTGDALQLPYLLHARQYMAVPLMFWGKLEHPKTRADYTNDQLAKQHLEYEVAYFEGQRTPRGWMVGQGVKLLSFAKLHLLRNPALLIGWFAAPFALTRDGRTWLPVVFLLAFVLAYAIIPWFEHHYVGAMIPVVFALGVRGLRRVYTWRPRRRRAGRAIVWLCIGVTFVILAAQRGTYRESAWPERQQIEQQLTADPAPDLVFVHYYGPDHDPGVEWVQNAADIDAAEIIWARHLSKPADRMLMMRYPDRTAWHLMADGSPPTLWKVEGSK